MAHSSAVAVAAYLSGNILALRKSRGLSQSQLAQLADIPRSTLTHIESGSGNPSLQNLSKISVALQVGVDELLSRPRNECSLILEADVPVQKRSHGKARLHRLIPDQVKGLEVDKIEIEVGAVMGGHPHLSGAKEYLNVIQGEITVQVAGEQFVVKRGSVFAFPGDQPHSYRNTGSSLAVALSIVIPVVLGAGI